MRLAVQGDAAVQREVRCVLGAAVDERSDVEEALGAQEVAVRGDGARQVGPQAVRGPRFWVARQVSEDGPWLWRQLARADELAALG